MRGPTSFLRYNPVTSPPLRNRNTPISNQRAAAAAATLPPAPDISISEDETRVFMRGKARGGRRVCSASSGRFPCKGCCWVVQARNPNRATCAWHVLGHRAEPRRSEAGPVINAKLDVEASTRRRVRREHGRVTKSGRG